MLNFLKQKVSLVAALAICAGSLAAQPTLSQSTKDALLHVLAHEIGHAMLREFDLPIVGPEEDIADDFANIYIYLTLPERAEGIIGSRARQNMADGEQPEMFSEYRNDDQRAGRSICILFGQDPDRYEALASRFGLEGDEAAACRDFPTEVGRSWRRIIDTYRMPPEARVTEVGLFVADSPFASALVTEEWRNDAYTLLSGIDWHSGIVLAIEKCDGGASWSRNGRRITICDEYVERFENQLAD